MADNRHNAFRFFVGARDPGPSTGPTAQPVWPYGQNLVDTVDKYVNYPSYTGSNLFWKHYGYGPTAGANYGNNKVHEGSQGLLVPTLCGGYLRSSGQNDGYPVSSASANAPELKIETTPYQTWNINFGVSTDTSPTQIGLGQPSNWSWAIVKYNQTQSSPYSHVPTMDSTHAWTTTVNIPTHPSARITFNMHLTPSLPDWRFPTYTNFPTLNASTTGYKHGENYTAGWWYSPVSSSVGPTGDRSTNRHQKYNANLESWILLNKCMSPGVTRHAMCEYGGNLITTGGTGPHYTETCTCTPQTIQTSQAVGGTNAYSFIYNKSGGFTRVTSTVNPISKRFMKSALVGASRGADNPYPYANSGATNLMSARAMFLGGQNPTCPASPVNCDVSQNWIMTFNQHAPADLGGQWSASPLSGPPDPNQPIMRDFPCESMEGTSIAYGSGPYFVRTVFAGNASRATSTLSIPWQGQGSWQDNAQESIHGGRMHMFANGSNRYVSFPSVSQVTKTSSPVAYGQNSWGCTAGPKSNRGYILGGWTPTLAPYCNSQNIEYTGGGDSYAIKTEMPFAGISQGGGVEYGCAVNS